MVQLETPPPFRQLDGARGTLGRGGRPTGRSSGTGGAPRRGAAGVYCPDIDADEARSAASQSVARAKKAASGAKVEYHGEERDPRYFFKRSTLWERLEGIAAPVKSQLRAIIDDATAAEHKKERDAARWSDHYTGDGVKAGNAQKRATARLLAAQGYSQRAIASEVGVSQQAVGKWLKGDN